MPLDFIRLKERRLERTWCDVERDRACLRQHLERALGHAILFPKVAVDAMMKRRCLADVQDAAICPEHAINAWHRWQRKAYVPRHRPNAASTGCRLGRSGEPVVKRAPRRNTLHLEHADQLSPDERCRFDVIGAAAPRTNRATEVSRKGTQAAARQIREKAPGNIPRADHVERKHAGG